METYNSIELTKQLVKDGKISQEIAETIFPELKESEDERIRKEMISWLKGFIGEEGGCGYTDEEIRKRIAWLEKQGEQKCNEVKPIEGEFPYINPSDNLDDEIDNIWNRLNCNGVFTATKEGFKEVICHFVNFVSKNPAWSEDDEAMLNNIIHLFRTAYTKTDGIDEKVEFLKFLKGSIQSQCRPSEGRQTIAANKDAEAVYNDFKQFITEN